MCSTPQVQSQNGEPLKVCAAENEMPYSNSQGEGFENKLAEFVGKELGRKIEYVGWKDPRYFIRDMLDKKQCDLVMGLDTGDPRVATTASLLPFRLCLHHQGRKCRCGTKLGWRA